MIRKAYIAYCIFTVALCYIISPWLFEKFFLFNELLAAVGLLSLIYKRFRIGKDVISICMALLIMWGSVHAVTSLFRMDSFYYYLRNMVILYSMFGFFIGYFCLKYLSSYIDKIRTLLRQYIGIFVFFPLHRFLFERFGMSMLFPALFKNANNRWVPYLLLFINIVYAFVYNSLTALVLAAFYIFLFISPGYKFFIQILAILFLAFTGLFIYLQPNLSLISWDYSHYNTLGIYHVIRSHPILALDGNSTWRLVLWKEIIVDNFPGNILGIGFGTPALQFYPVANYSEMDSLPYVLGAHNSFIYLFGRLGIIYILLTITIYLQIFKDYFNYKKYYYSNNQVFLFWSFFASTIIALFNPALESPIYASGYWLILGFTAKAIHTRYLLTQKRIVIESLVYT